MKCTVDDLPEPELILVNINDCPPTTLIHCLITFSIPPILANNGEDCLQERLYFYFQFLFIYLFIYLLIYLFFWGKNYVITTENIEMLKKYHT